MEEGAYDKILQSLLCGVNWVRWVWFRLQVHTTNPLFGKSRRPRVGSRGDLDDTPPPRCVNGTPNPSSLICGPQVALLSHCATEFLSRAGDATHENPLASRRPAGSNTGARAPLTLSAFFIPPPHKYAPFPSPPRADGRPGHGSRERIWGLGLGDWGSGFRVTGLEKLSRVSVLGRLMSWATSDPYRQAYVVGYARDEAKGIEMFLYSFSRTLVSTAKARSAAQGSQPRPHTSVLRGECCALCLHLVTRLAVWLGWY